MAAGKPRIAKDYDKLTEELIAQIKIEYPFGFEDNLISYKNAQGVKISALPFETEDVYYLIKMTKAEAQQIIEDDEDYDDDGNLKEGFAEEAAGQDDTSSDEEEEEDSYDKADDDAGDDDDD
jgi:DNA-directed RNA polymerase subunit delta